MTVGASEPQHEHPTATTTSSAAGALRPTGRRAPGGRIDGLDVARALAMAGMVVVHYVWPDQSGVPADLLARGMLGRAMPLFMVLGGIGVTILASRRPDSDATLVARAAILFLMGLVVDAISEWVAVVLQSYGLFFALAPLFRRLPTWALAGSSALVAVVGSWTFQVMGTFPRTSTSFDDLADPIGVIRSLVVDGYYPFFPVASFFLLGMVLGRLDLRSRNVAATLAAAGLMIGVGSIIVVNGIISANDLDVATFESARRSVNPDGFDTARFSWSRLLHLRGHSQMLAWVISAAGTSVATIGVSLLIARPLRPILGPILALGRLALTFYVFQVALTQVITRPTDTPFRQELITAAAIYVGFMVIATIWTTFFRAGPLEALVRAGSGPGMWDAFTGGGINQPERAGRGPGR